MYIEAVKGRQVIHEEQKLLGMTLDELIFAIRGRFSWDIENKRWKCSYRPCRDYWLLLLLSINNNIFVL